MRPAVLNGKNGKTDERTFSDVRARSSCPLSMWLSANVTENGNVTATGETERTRSVASEIGLRRDVAYESFIHKIYAVFCLSGVSLEFLYRRLNTTHDP